MHSYKLQIFLINFLQEPPPEVALLMPPQTAALAAAGCEKSFSWGESFTSACISLHLPPAAACALSKNSSAYAAWPWHKGQVNHCPLPGSWTSERPHRATNRLPASNSHASQPCCVNVSSSLCTGSPSRPLAWNQLVLEQQHKSLDSDA